MKSSLTMGEFVTVQLLNLSQLRNKLSLQIQDIHEKIHSDVVKESELIALLDALLVERDFLLNELDTFKLQQDQWLKNVSTIGNEFSLLLSELDESIYNDFVNLAHRLEIPIGELISILMNEITTSREDKKFPRLSAHDLEQIWVNRHKRVCIGHQSTVQVTENDLLEYGGYVIFENIDLLEFVDVELHTFIKYVKAIRNCRRVVFPSNYPKMIIFARSSNCDFFELFEPPVIEYAKEANDIVTDWSNGHKEV